MTSLLRFLAYIAADEPEQIDTWLHAAKPTGLRVRSHVRCALLRVNAP